MPLFIFNIIFYGITAVLFFAILSYSKEQGSNRLIDHNGYAKKPMLLLMLHVLGILLFAVLPLCFNSSTPLVIIKEATLYSWSSGITILVVGFIFFLSPKIADKEKVFQSNQHNESIIDKSVLMPYFIIRVFFITVYEIWFRGFLLNDSIAFLGSGGAIFINILLYTLLHIVNGKKEMLSCIPFGLLLCVLCIWNGSVWPAIVIHLTLTLTYEVTLVRKMQIKSITNESFNYRGIGLHR